MIQDFSAFKNEVAARTPDDPERIAILIKTINRKHLLFPTIESILKYSDVPFRLYIGDDGSIDEEQREVYGLLQKAGHFVRVYEKPIALTSGLNDLVRATDGEKFVLRIDDDRAFCPKTRINVMHEILDLVPSLGAISGAERKTRYGRKASEAALSIGQGFFVQLETTLYRVNVASSNMHYTIVGGHRFSVVGHAPNFLLIRRSVLDDVPWNEELIFSGEHMDFFLRLAKSGWLLGFTPDCEHLHVQDGILTSDYTGRAHALPVAAKEKLFLRDYGVKHMKGIDLSKKLGPDRGSLVDRLKQRLAGALR